jgi:hypothetical protein
MMNFTLSAEDFTLSAEDFTVSTEDLTLPTPYFIGAAVMSLVPTPSFTCYFVR